MAKKDFTNMALGGDTEFNFNEVAHATRTETKPKAPKVKRREYCLYLQPSIMSAFKSKVDSQELKVNVVLEHLLTDYINKK